MVTAEETSNPRKLDSRRSADFTDLISNHQLIDLGFIGPGLTWTRGTTTSSFKGTRLDRALCNAAWRLRFDGAAVMHLPKLNSDHSPLLIRTEDEEHLANKVGFKFQAAWLTRTEVKEVGEACWKKQEPLGENIKAVTDSLSTWNKECFGNVFRNKRRLWARIEGVQRKLTERRTNNLLKLEKKLQRELDLILRQEELIWFQRSCEDWINSGGRNTKFYHASTIVRRSRNKIRALKNSEGVWVTDKYMLEVMMQEY